MLSFLASNSASVFFRTSFRSSCFSLPDTIFFVCIGYALCNLFCSWLLHSKSSWFNMKLNQSLYLEQQHRYCDNEVWLKLIRQIDVSHCEIVQTACICHMLTQSSRTDICHTYTHTLRYTPTHKKVDWSRFQKLSSCTFYMNAHSKKKSFKEATHLQSENFAQSTICVANGCTYTPMVVHKKCKRLDHFSLYSYTYICMYALTYIHTYSGIHTYRGILQACISIVASQNLTKTMSSSKSFTLQHFSTVSYMHTDVIHTYLRSKFSSSSCIWC